MRGRQMWRRRLPHCVSAESSDKSARKLTSFLTTGVRGIKMNLKLVAAFAAALLLGACASSEKPATDNTGSSTGGNTAGQAAPGSVEEFQVSVGDRVFFDYDSYEV